MSYHYTKSGGQRHCASGNKIVIVCNVILKYHVIKEFKSAITIFSKARDMSYWHIRNFVIKVTLTKTFACVSSDSSLILVTPSCVTNDESYVKKLSPLQSQLQETK